MASIDWWYPKGKELAGLAKSCLFAYFVGKDTTFENEATPYVGEYFMRKRLAKLGFTSSFNELDSMTADVFMAIDSYIEELKAKEMAKQTKKAR